MTTTDEPVIVSNGACHGCSASTVQVHHRNYPETMAEGMSIEISARHLIDHLVRSLDHTPDRAARGRRNGHRRSWGLPEPSRSRAARPQRREHGRRECHGDSTCAAGRGHRRSPARAGVCRREDDRPDQDRKSGGPPTGPSRRQGNPHPHDPRRDHGPMPGGPGCLHDRGCDPRFGGRSTAIPPGRTTARRRGDRGCLTSRNDHLPSRFVARGATGLVLTR